MLVIVKPETVAAWHRAGFRLFWRMRSRANNKGRPKTDAELRRLIKRMASENPTWGSPRIHGELLKLGFEVSERSVSRYIRRLSPPNQARKLWAAFLRNHREVVAAMDSFTVPTLTFRVLYCFFIIEHGRRKILHINVTEHPTGPWMVQQLREAFRLLGKQLYLQPFTVRPNTFALRYAEACSQNACMLVSIMLTYNAMNVISKRGLIQLARVKRIDGDTMNELVAWYQVARHTAWTNLLDVRREFPTADQVGAVIVFNIRHNRYRLITRVELSKQLMFVKALLNHKEYDREDWKKWA